MPPISLLSVVNAISTFRPLAVLLFVSLAMLLTGCDSGVINWNP